MTLERPPNVRLQRLGLSLACTLVIVAISLLVLQFSSRAAMVMFGRDGCGNFIEALNAAPPGRILAMMDRIPRESSNAIVTKSITIQGGWTRLGGGGCDEENQRFPTGPGEANTHNFYLNPDTRSYLENIDLPVLRIVHSGILTIENMGFIQDSEAQTGGGISGRLTDGARLLLRNVEFNESRATENGGGLYLEVRGGARVIVDRGLFTDNEAFGNGGAFEIRVYDHSHVIITNSRIQGNVAQDKGGGGHILIDSGYVTLTNNIFEDNQSATQVGNDLTIERIGYGPAQVWLNDNTFSGKRKPDSQQVRIGNGVVARGNNLFNAFLPLRMKNAPHPLPWSPPWPTATPTATPTPHARITNITVQNGTYLVSYYTYGFTPQLPGVHLHFFFDTVPPEQAGVPGSGPWKLNPSADGQPASNPFTGYRVADRPDGADRMCVYVANENHSIRLGTGNCSPLP